MTLVDAGPLLAIIDAEEPDHRRCIEALGRIEPPLVTTWPALAEAMHLAGSRTGWPGQEALWRLVLRGDLDVVAPDGGHLVRAHDLMRKYRDVPMDLADATLVALAEERKIDRIFTLDSDFRVYRLHGRRAFTIVP